MICKTLALAGFVTLSPILKLQAVTLRNSANNETFRAFVSKLSNIEGHEYWASLINVSSML